MRRFKSPSVFRVTKPLPGESEMNHANTGFPELPGSCFPKLSRNGDDGGVGAGKEERRGRIKEGFKRLEEEKRREEKKD